MEVQTSTLPVAFRDLEPFVEHWALDSNQARFERRRGSRIEEIEVFYRAMLPRVEAVLNYLDGFPVNDLPPPEEALFRLSLAFAEAALAAEIYRVPDLPLAVGPSRFNAIIYNAQS